MTERQQLADLLMRQEAVRLRVYDDATGKPLTRGMTLKGNPTIGAGRNLAGNGITFAEAMLLLDHDLDTVIHDLATFAWFGRMNNVRQMAIVSLRYNVGPRTFRTFTTLLAALEREDYPGAAAALRGYLWYRQVKQRGPVLARMIETGQEGLRAV